MQQAAYTGNAGANNTTTGKAPPCKLFGVLGRITYRAMPLDTVRDSLHGASAYTARVVTHRILHRMYHQCGNTDTYFSSLSLCPPRSAALLSTSPCPGMEQSTHPSATLPVLNPPPSPPSHPRSQPPPANESHFSPSFDGHLFARIRNLLLG